MSYISCNNLLVFMLNTGYAEEGNARELYAESDWSEASGHSFPFSLLFKQQSQRFLLFFWITPYEVNIIPHKTWDHHLGVLVLGHYNLISEPFDATQRYILFNT